MANFHQLKEWVTQDWKAQAAFREAAQEDFEFEAGHQWTDTEISQLESQSRIPIVFNRVAAIIASVEGSEINNRTELRFIPREPGDAEVNEVLTAGADWFRDEAQAEDEESESFSDLLICGMGWTETALDFQTDEDGNPLIARLDPLEMCWDSSARRQGLSDSGRFARVRLIPRMEAEEMFPDAHPEEIDADWLEKRADDEDWETTHNVAGDEYADGDETTGDNKDMVRVVQVQYRERTRLVQFIDPQTGEKSEMTKAQWAMVTERRPDIAASVQVRPVTRTVWKQAFLGQTILAENMPNMAGPTFNCMTGKWDRKDKRFTGFLRNLKDPQKFANKWLSQMLFIIGANSKGGVLAETGAVDDTRAFEESWAAADSVTWLKDGALARVQPKQHPQMPAALMTLTEFAVSSIRDVSGVSLELMGMREQDQAGVLEYQRRQSSMNSLARYFNALKRYRKTQGKVILEFLRNHIAPTGRLIRIVEQGQQRFVRLAVEHDSARYDVIIDDAPSAPSEKDRTWSVLQAMLPMLAQAGLKAEDWADILEYSPLPASFSEKIREKARTSGEGQPSPLEQAQTQYLQSEAQKSQMDAQKGQADIAKAMAQALLDRARASEIMQDTRLKPLQAIKEFMPGGMIGTGEIAPPSATPPATGV